MQLVARLTAVLFVVVRVTAADDAGVYFTLRDGLQHAPRVFSETGKGRVAFLGGSITEMKGWRNLVCDALRRRFPSTAFDFINAGVSSMGSTNNAFRMERDVFGHGRVDLLFQEAAVNDLANNRSDQAQIRAVEGIVRHALRRNPNMDVLMIHFAHWPMICEYMRGHEPAVVRNHERVAAHYHVASLNLVREVTERIRKKEFEWYRDFGSLHPLPFGQRIYADSVVACLEAAWQQPAAAAPAPRTLPPKLLPDCYDAGRLEPPTRATQLHGFSQIPKWHNHVKANTLRAYNGVPVLAADRPGSRFELVFSGTAVGLFVLAGPDAGTIAFQVDAGEWQRRDLFHPASVHWQLPYVYMLGIGLAAAPGHHLSVRLLEQKNTKSKGTACRVLGFAVNGEETLSQPPSDGRAAK